MASVAVELNKQSDSSLASKSSRPHVPMDIVPLNDPSIEKHNEVQAKCSHFSIRGYVSEVRKKDPTICYPFSLKDSIKPLYTELPPMEVPKFRWWQCIGCVPEVGVSYDNGTKEAPKLDENGDVPLTVVGEIVKINVPRERNGEASTSTDSNDNRNGHKNVVDDPKGKGKVHVDDEPALPSACNNGFLKDPTQVILQHTDRLEVCPSASNQVIELGSNCHENGTKKALQKASRECQIEAGLAKDSLNQNGECANEKFQDNSQASPHNLLGVSQTNTVRAEVVRVVNGPRNDSKSHLLNLPDLNECSGEPLYEENNEALVNISTKNDVDCEDDDDYLGAECRKNPKVRLLSELLGLKETQISVKGRKKNRSLTSSLDENGKRKRVGSQEEGSKSTEIRVSDNGIKKASRTTESSETASEYASDSDYTSSEIISKTLAKRRCKSRVPLLEKKNKKMKVDHGGSSTNRNKLISKSPAHDKGKASENMPPKSDFTDKLVERSLVVTKKRGRIIQASKEGSSLNPCKTRVPKEIVDTKKDEIAEKRSNQKLQKGSENDLHVPRGLNCQDSVGLVGCEPCLASSQAGPMLVDGNNAIKRQERMNEGVETSVAFRSTAVGNTSRGDSSDGHGECTFDAKTDMEKKNSIQEADGGSLLAQDSCVKASNSVANHKETNKEARGRIHDIDINSIPIDDKATDDIPMDIVELMAKNQYERQWSDPKEPQLYPSTPDISKRYIRDNTINGFYGDYFSKFNQSPFLTMPRPPSNPDLRNSMANGNLGYFSDYNRNSLSLTNHHPREYRLPSHLYSPNRPQEHCAPYSSCGLTPNNWNRNFNLGTPQRYSPNLFHAVESYRQGACAPRQNTIDPSHVWPSMVANRVPLGMTNHPQMMSNSSSKGKFSYHQTSGSILTFNTPGSTGLGKQQNLNFSNGGYSESSGGSADTYYNDAVSAMNLLSLMQNAARMHNAPGLSLGPSQTVMGPTTSSQPNTSRNYAVQENARHPCYPTPIPTALPSVMSFQKDGNNFRRNSSNNGFVGPIPLTLRGQRNIESSHFGLQGGDHRHQRLQMGSLENRKDISVISPPSSVSSLQGTKNGVPSFFCAREVRRDERTISPIREKLICKLNQNPSEFTDMKEQSRYMIGPDDLRPRKTAREKSVRGRGDSKRQEKQRI